MRRQVTLFGCCLLVAASAIAQQASTSASTPTKPASQAAPQQPAPPANPITDAQAHELMELTGASKMQEQLVTGMTAYFQQRIPFAPKDVIDDLVQSLSKVDLQTPIIALYKQHISTTDADAIIAFYKTPAGKNMIHTMPAIMMQSERIGAELGQKTAQQVFERHKPEIEAALKQYQAEHAPKSGSSTGTGSGSGSSTTSTAPAAKPQQ
ncbi:DUF2059 domain-containing protein [Silvibacterium dinghuense]|uniref:DUF2059 domain-containing protein n=1 Tax=Silvibacterium dinghuense TaxID=1560006 RepID=A0A4V1NVM7_9BACT|nr:DUF2059 domain-containing protein [Silvibacterium dinghuense]RXS96462.1 DUF2059 domain-containing protein [Silvibacterium dinghuense]GGG90963.1 hypothetical protein GCM10011586_01890 [Silvibacterium dinghuense]